MLYPASPPARCDPNGSQRGLTLSIVAVPPRSLVGIDPKQLETSTETLVVDLPRTEPRRPARSLALDSATTEFCMLGIFGAMAPFTHCREAFRTVTQFGDCNSCLCWDRLSTIRADREYSIWCTWNDTKPASDLGSNLEANSDRPSGEEFWKCAGSGCLSIMAGVRQLFCHTLEVQPAKRGRIRVTFCWEAFQLSDPLRQMTCFTSLRTRRRAGRIENRRVRLPFLWAWKPSDPEWFTSIRRHGKIWSRATKSRWYGVAA